MAPGSRTATGARLSAGGVRERRDARLAHVVEVVDRDRAQLGGHLGAAHVAELVGVQLGQQSVLEPGLEHAAALLDGEGPLLAERVAETGQLCLAAAGIIFLTIIFT